MSEPEKYQRPSAPVAPSKPGRTTESSVDIVNVKAERSQPTKAVPKKGK